MTLSAPDLEFLRSLVQEQTGNLIDPSRDYLFESRLHSLLRARGLASVHDLVASLRSTRSCGLRRAFADSMMVNETSFFRDPPVFELLRTQLLPHLVERRRPSRTLRLWSAATSSGQEAWSLAILIREHLPALAHWTIDILGTDISSAMIERAHAGRYTGAEVTRGLTPPLLARYFLPAGSGWEIAPPLRPLCRFRQRNLCSAPARPEIFDVILLRNALLYFSPSTRGEVLRAIHRSLAPDGALLLGHSEQPDADPHWQPVLTPTAVWYRPLPLR